MDVGIMGPEMHIDAQFLFNTVLGVVLAGVGWFARQIWDAVQRLQHDLHDLEVRLPSNYIRRDEFTDAVRELKDMLGKIFDRLDSKMDKEGL